MNQSKTRRSISVQFLYAILIVAAIVPYLNTFSVPFLLDDANSIQNNPSIQNLLDLRAVLSPPGQGVTVDGRPILNLSFALNWALHREHVWGYHVANLAIHVANGLLLFSLAKRVFERIPTTPDGWSTGAAFFASLLWIIHPLNTSAVTYIVQRAESLMAFWCLLGILASLRFIETGRLPHAVIAIVSGILGMATKENMVVFPILAAGLVLVASNGSMGVTLWRNRAFSVALALTWIPLVWLMSRTSTRGGTVGFGGEISSGEYVLTQLVAVPMYLGLFFWPARLVFDYGRVLVTNPTEAAIGAFWLVIAMVVLVGLTRWSRIVGFLFFAYFVALSPTSTFVPVISQTIGEHRTYLPNAFLSMVVVACFAQAACVISNREWRRVARGFCVSLGFVVAVALGSRTYLRNRDFESAERIWTLTWEQTGQPRAKANLVRLGLPVESSE